MQESSRSSAWSRLARFGRLNPCFVLAIAASAGAGLWGWPERPVFPLRPDQVAEVVGWVSRSPECRKGLYYFELQPESVQQAGEAAVLAGVIAVQLYSGEEDLCRRTVPPVSFDQRIRLRTLVTEPNHFAVPGVADYRDIQWWRGVVATIRLKSAAQIENLKPIHRSFVLGPLFRYAESFRRYCARNFSALQNRLILSAFLGEKGVLQEEDREQIRSLGVLHLFVVSGFHVSLILAVLHWPFGRLGWAGRLVGLLGMWAYVAVTGAATSSIRAGVMTSLFYLYLFSGLGKSVLNFLGLTALGMLAVRPGLVFEGGFQFSFLALAAIGLIAIPCQSWIRNVRRGFVEVWSRRVSLAPAQRPRRRVRFHLEEKLEFFPRKPARLACRLTGPVLGWLLTLQACNLAIQITTLPLVLFHSNQIVWTQDLANLVLAPSFSGFVVVCLLLFCSFRTPLDMVAAQLTSLYSDALTTMLTWLEGVSLCDWWPHPGLGATLVYWVLLWIGGWKLKGWRRIWLAAIPALLLVALVWRPDGGTGLLRITMLDVGQGEAIHVRYPNGESALVDTGGLRSPDGAPTAFVGERLVGRYLWEERVGRLAFVLLSHPHVDHIQGFEFLRKVFPVGFLLFHEGSGSYRGAPETQVSRGDSLLVGGVEHRILHPGGGGRPWGTNDASIVMLMRHGGFSMLFTGDIERQAERALLPTLGKVTVLKVPHHGGAGSCSSELLEALAPQAALISAGRRNAFGHPSGRALSRLVEADTPVFTTALLGTLRIETDGRFWRLSRYDGKMGGFRLLLERSVN